MLYSDSGLFHFLAVRIVTLTRGNPRKLLPAIMAVTVAFVTFLTIKIRVRETAKG